MRVIAGEAKGHHLKGPASKATRPMSDKIRQALFSSLASLGVEPEQALDLYAGTGSIGIETLSRGADHCDFVDQSREACAVIKQNLKHTKMEGRSTVHPSSVGAFIRHARNRYDFVSLDPPYADPGIVDTLESVSRSQLLISSAVVVLGHAPFVELPDQIDRLTLVKRRCHGDSCFSIFELTE